MKMKNNCIMVAHVYVGNINGDEAKKYLKRTKNRLKKKSPKKTKWMVFPSFSEQTRIETINFNK